MRQMIVLSYMSLDGLATSDVDMAEWIAWDDSVTEIYTEAYRAADTVLFGRRSFEALRGYWPTSLAKNEPRELVEATNNYRKIVFSRTLKDPDWQNSVVVPELTRRYIEELKASPGKDLIVIGSGNLVSQMAPWGVIDEYRLILLPSVIGRGTPYFRDLAKTVRLELIENKAYKPGNVLLRYRPATG